MALDGIVLSKICANFKNKLPIKINRIIQISEDELIMNLHYNKIKSNLIISINPNYNRINFTDKNYPPIDNPSNFLINIKKKIVGGIIYDVQQIEYDRFLILKIKNINEIYDEVHYELHIELMGKYANIILVNSDNHKIIDLFKKIPIYENSKRILQVNSTFSYIQSQNKIDPFSISNFDSHQLQGFSFLLEKELRFRLSNNESFYEIMENIKFSQNLYCYQNEFHIIELKHLNQQALIFKIDDGFDFFYNQLANKKRIKKIENKIYKLIKRNLKSLENKINKINQDLINSKNFEKYKIYGDCLFMNGELNKKGLNQIQTLDYDGNNLLIELNSKLSLKENANKYYQKYQKLKKGINHLKRELNLAQDKLNYFKILNEQLEFSNQNDIKDIKVELFNLGYLKENNKYNHKNKKIPSIYKVEINNKTILFGKNNIQNAFLTFKLANKNNYFFHVKDYHGSHVIINDNKLNEEEIRLCSLIAAYFSGAKNSSSIPVDYCLIKDVKKINGAKVSISNYKTIYIDIDHQKLRKYNII